MTWNRERGRVVFVADFVHLDCSFDAAALLLDPTGAWSVAFELFARRDGGPVNRGEARRRRSSLTVPISWAVPAAHARQQRVVIDADLELLPLGEVRCRLGLNGRFRLPATRLDVPTDALAIHGVAEASLRRLLSELPANTT